MDIPRQRSLSTPRRTFSLPSKPPRWNPSATGTLNTNAASSGQNVEVLFAHTSSRIVNFTVTPDAFKNTPLPWRGPEERTIASGSLQIYKTIPHDIAFLQSGSALRPLLSKTQCWNVDGKKIFCLQIRPGSYWRIEILGVEEEQAVRAVEFRDILVKTIAYEVTACPFVRAEDCAPLIEAPEAMLPVRVWKRPPLRKILPKEPVEVDANVERENALEEIKNKLFQGPTEKIQDNQGCPKINQLDTAAENLKISCRKTEEQVTTSDYGLDSPPIVDSSLTIGQSVELSQPSNMTPKRSRSVESLSSSSTLVPSLGENLTSSPGGGWLDFTPPNSPVRQCPIAARKTHIFSPIAFRPPAAVPPVVNNTEALGITSRHNTPPPSTPPHRRIVSAPMSGSPNQRPGDISLRKRRKSKSPALKNLDVLHPMLAEAAEISPALSTPNLTSGSDSDDENPPDEIKTPPRSTAAHTVDSAPAITQPRLRKAASSLILSRTTSLASTTASYIVIKPSAYLMAAMFSIATRIASKAVSGAAYKIDEARPWSEEWSEDDIDDFDMCHPSSESWERERIKAWGVEEISRTSF